MKRFTPLLFLLLAACVNTEGLSAETSRTPTGNPAAMVTVIDFTDLQCPACRTTQQSTVDPLLQEYGNVIRYEVRHFPLRSIHPFAQEAAEAAECAADQGRFWEFMEDVYSSPESQSQLSREGHLERARRIGVADSALFERCMHSRIKRSVVNDDYKEGERLNVTGTPTFFIDGEKAPNNSLTTVKQMVEEAIRRSRL